MADFRQDSTTLKNILFANQFAVFYVKFISDSLPQIQQYFWQLIPNKFHIKKPQTDSRRV